MQGKQWKAQILSLQPVYMDVMLPAAQQLPPALLDGHQ
jgi:hypothetical protein